VACTIQDTQCCSRKPQLQKQTLLLEKSNPVHKKKKHKREKDPKDTAVTNLSDWTTGSAGINPQQGFWKRFKNKQIINVREDFKERQGREARIEATQCKLTKILSTYLLTCSWLIAIFIPS
jgi:hypothetical protein